jgi:hypothetical protein
VVNSQARPSIAAASRFYRIREAPQECGSFMGRARAVTSVPDRLERSTPTGNSRPPCIDFRSIRPAAQESLRGLWPRSEKSIRLAKVDYLFRSSALRLKRTRRSEEMDRGSYVPVSVGLFANQGALPKGLARRHMEKHEKGQIARWSIQHPFRDVAEATQPSGQMGKNVPCGSPQTGVSSSN